MATYVSCKTGKRSNVQAYNLRNSEDLTLPECWTVANLEQTPLNRCQQLPAPYKRLIHDRNETDKRTSITDRLNNTDRKTDQFD